MRKQNVTSATLPLRRKKKEKGVIAKNWFIATVSKVMEIPVPANVLE